MFDKNTNLKENNLAYGGQALIEGVLMRGKGAYAYTIKKPDDSFYKEKINYTVLGKRIKFFGLPFIRGIIGFVESLLIGIKVLNKSALIAFPEEEDAKKKNKAASDLTMILLFIVSFAIAFVIFVGIPYLLTSLTTLNHNNNPILYNLVAGIIRMIFFFIYLILISFLKDTKRLFGYHGAEHKTIHTYESKVDLTVENVKKYSRLHPRCGTSFIFIVFIITLIIFPFFNLFFNTQSWYHAVGNLPFGSVLQRLIHILSHIIVGMPIVAALSYELLKLSQKLEKNPIIKVLISPGLFFQLFTTREPDETMIKAAIYSLKMVLDEEKEDIIRNIKDTI